MPRAAPRLAAMDAMDAEGGTALTAPQLLSDACNHCVVVVDTTGELGGFWAMRSWPKTFQYEAERVARISQEQRLTHRSYHRARVPRWSLQPDKLWPDHDKL